MRGLGLVAIFLAFASLGCGGARAPVAPAASAVEPPLTQWSGPQGDPIRLTEGAIYPFGYVWRLEFGDEDRFYIARGAVVVESAAEDHAIVRVLYADDTLPERTGWVGARMRVVADGTFTQVRDTCASDASGASAESELIAQHLFGMRRAMGELPALGNERRLADGRVIRVLQRRDPIPAREFQMGHLHMFGTDEFSVRTELDADAWVGRRLVRRRALGVFRDPEAGDEAREGEVTIEIDTRVEPPVAALPAELADANACVETGAQAPFTVRDVVMTINDRHAELRECFHRELARDRTLHGRVRITLTVLPSGGMSEVRALEYPPGLEPTAECVVAIASTFVVTPAPTEPTTYEFPFVFEPLEDSGSDSGAESESDSVSVSESESETETETESETVSETDP